MGEEEEEDNLCNPSACLISCTPRPKHIFDLPPGAAAASSSVPILLRSCAQVVLPRNFP